MNRNLSAFNDRLCLRMVNEETLLCSPKTLRNAWSFVATVIENETGKRYSVPLPKSKKVPHAFLDFQQIKVFVLAIQGTSLEIPALLALNSLRRSEIYGLRWKDVDLVSGTVTINGAVVVGENEERIYKDTAKNDTSSRTIEIIIPRLLDLMKEADKSKPIVSFSPDTLLRQVNRVCEQNNLPKVGVHGLRHSFASLAYHLRIPKEIAREIGGWKNDIVMDDIYTHLAAADVNEHRERLKSFYAELT